MPPTLPQLPLTLLLLLLLLLRVQILKNYTGEYRPHDACATQQALHIDCPPLQHVLVKMHIAIQHCFECTT